MDLLSEYLDILQNIETPVIAAQFKHPGYTDKHALLIYEKLLSRFDRQRRGLPELPHYLNPPVSQIYEVVLFISRQRTTGDELATSVAQTVKPGVMCQILKKLIASVRNRSSSTDPKQYLRTVGADLLMDENTFTE